jgi:hypothetical protein
MINNKDNNKDNNLTESEKTQRRNKISKNRQKETESISDEYKHLNKAKKEFKNKKNSIRADEIWEEWNDYT